MGTIEDRVLDRWKELEGSEVSERDFLNSLSRDKLDSRDFYNLISDPGLEYIEELAERARSQRLKFFGNNVNIFSPLYISNYCENSCRYCGFRRESNIKRGHLNMEEIQLEMKSLQETGIEEVLILTGEAPSKSSIQYIGQAIKLGKKYFRVIGLEIYPCDIEDYRYFKECGADFVTIFQETYNKEAYEFFHPRGNKSDFSYRFNSQERALEAGMRGVGFGALFGLSDPIEDSFKLAYHAKLLQQDYPAGEIAISLPRIRPIKDDEDLKFEEVSEKKLFQILLAIRIFLPFVSITISTRETREFRNLALLYSANKVSASVDTGIGRRSGKTKDEKIGEEQFLIQDDRSEEDLEADLMDLGLSPVLSDYLYL